MLPFRRSEMCHLPSNCQRSSSLSALPGWSNGNGYAPQCHKCLFNAGFGLLESGLVSKKDEVNIMMKNAIDVIVGGLSFWLFGYAFSFGDDVTFLGGFTGGNRFMLRSENDEDSGSDYAWFFFQSSFATTATTIGSGR